MSGELKQACLIMQRAADVPARPPREPELARLARRLQNLPLGGDLREPEDIEEAAKAIRSAIARGDEITSRQLRQGIWCLWNQNTRLADDDVVRTRLFDSVAVSDRPRAFRTLAANFLEAFGPDEVGIVPAGALLSSLAPKWEGNWQRLHRDYRIFDVVEGPKALARAVAAQDRPPDEILQAHDVSLMSARGGYVKAVIGSLLDHLANGGEPDTRIISHDRTSAAVGLFLPVTTARGLALLGLVEGQSFAWAGAGGTEQVVQLLEVLHQPEASRRQDRKPDAPRRRPELRLVIGARDLQPAKAGAATFGDPGGFDDPGPSAA